MQIALRKSIFSIHKILKISDIFRSTKAEIHGGRPEEKRELADPKSEKEWVKKHQAREKMLIESGVSKETLDKLVEYYNSKLDTGNMVARTCTNMIWQPPSK